MTTKEHAAAIRIAYKARGWSSRDISVRAESYSLGSSIHVTIKNPDVSYEGAHEIAKAAEVVRRDERTGDILGGGNRYVSVSYSHEAAAALKARYEAILTAAARAAGADASDRSLHPIGSTGFLLGKGTNGYGYSLWGDSYILSANEVSGLATALHVRLQK